MSDIGAKNHFFTFKLLISFAYSLLPKLHTRVRLSSPAPTLSHGRFLPSLSRFVVHRICEPNLDRDLRDTELGGDLLIHEAGRDKRENLPFSPGQRLIR